MTITSDLTVASMRGDAEGFVPAPSDLYRNIHKGIRAQLFDVTLAAGRVDPSSLSARVVLAGHVDVIRELLEMHASREDAVIDPVLQAHLPDLAEQVEHDHARLGPRFRSIVELAQDFSGTMEADHARLSHLLYLELAGFTSSYLAHQLVEERVVMPALLAEVGADAVRDMHRAISRGIPPEMGRRGLAMMLPTMNIDERVAALSGLRASAPPAAFDAVLGQLRSSIAPADYADLTARLDAR